MEADLISQRVIGCALRVHTTLGPGFVESVYQNALACEFRKSAIPFSTEVRLRVRYGGEIVGEFVADMIVDDRLLIENKAVRALTPAHEVQVVNYLTATGIEIGLLFNFGAGRLQIRRKVRTYRPSTAFLDRMTE